MGCGKWFQVNRAPRVEKTLLLRAHLDGTPFRSLADQHSISVGSAYNYCVDALEALPHCADVTREYCQKFSGILLVDGKYVKVKGYDRKIPVVYGIDYATHDIPHYVLSRAENYPTCSTFFRSLKLMNYQLQAVVCDDNQNIYQASQKIYPHSVVQLCQIHYLRTVRGVLDIDHQPQYAPFFTALITLFQGKRSPVDFDRRARSILMEYRRDATCVAVMLELERKKHLLQGYLNLKGLPTTTNLIESFNSHLQGRLDTIKGFESFKHADSWLNGYFLRRRTKKFTDCRGKFKHLNGKTSLSQTQKPGIEAPIFF